MRVLFISNLYPPYELGGMEIRCKETVDRLRQRGHICHVLTSDFDVRSQTVFEEQVTRTLHLQADIHYYRPLDFFLRRPGRERANRRALRDALDAFRPDTVFVWGLWNLSARVAYWAEQWMPGKVAYAVAGYYLMEPDAHETQWQRRVRRPWARVLLAPARWLALRILERERKAYPLALEHVTCVSAYVRRKLSEAGALPHGARVIYNGIDPQPFIEAAGRRSSSDGALHLIYTGGLVNHKGVHTAIEALGLLRQRGEAESLSLSLVGSGHPDYEAHLHQRVEALNLQAQIRFHERMPRDQIASILAQHDIFLFTSTFEEPMARTVMEAMAAGLAVIGTAVGGQSEMLEDEKNALVFPPDDPVALADCILRLRDDPALRVRLVDAGRETVLEHFTLERMVDEIEGWLKEITA